MNTLNGAPRAMAVVGVLVIAGACHRRAVAASPPPDPVIPAAQPATCAAVDGTLASGARADSLAGGYRLTLVASGGARSGKSTSGALTLTRYGTHVPPVATGASGGTRYPTYGFTSIVPDSVGATAPGDVAATDQDAPGVLVMEWPKSGGTGGVNVMLRLGARANRGGATPIEGDHLALTVQALSTARFAGTWTSGLPGRQSSGHFCAERTAAR